MNRSIIDKPTLRNLALLAAGTALVYTILSYGGIRSPDSEVVFRTAESLATRGSFGLEKDLQGLKGFGLPLGRDGKYYSVFGPGQSVAAAPLVRLALWIDETGWYQKVPRLVPISHYVDKGLVAYVKDEAPRTLEPHALRFLVSSFNVITCSLCVCVFFLLVRLLTGSDVAAWCVSVLLAFGSLLMPYSGTFFSEPLATLLVTVSVSSLVWNDLRTGTPTARSYLRVLASGIFLGMATTVHVSAILFAPFFLAYALHPFLERPRVASRIVAGASSFFAGLGLFLLLLGYYDQVRFGSVLETGRTAAEDMSYAVYVAPWRGLYGLVLGAGKGLVWFCPAALAAAVLWRPFHVRFRFLSWTIVTAFLFRVCFLAFRSDWHGGFCLGPRYLLMAVPLLLLPLGVVVAQWIEQGRRRELGLFFLLTLVCVSEQIAFCIGEVFSFLHAIKLSGMAHGVNVFVNDALYLDWDKSALLFLLDFKRGPFLLRWVPVSNHALWLLSTALAGALLLGGCIALLRKHRERGGP